MKKYLILVVALLALAVAAFFVGCSDNSSTGSDNRSVTVSAPATGVSWTVGTTHTIRWSTVNVDSVDVYLLINGTSVGQLNTANNNRALTADSLSWIVTDHVSTSAAIKVVAHSDAATYGTSGIFTIAGLPPLVAKWVATPLSLQPLFVDSMNYYLRNDVTSSYLWRTYAGGTHIDEIGTYTSSADSIFFHGTTRDGQVVDLNYSRRYALSGANTVLTLHVMGEVRPNVDSLYTVTFNKFPLE